MHRLHASHRALCPPAYEPRTLHGQSRSSAAFRHSQSPFPSSAGLFKLTWRPHVYTGAMHGAHVMTYQSNEAVLSFVVMLRATYVRTCVLRVVILLARMYTYCIALAPLRACMHSHQSIAECTISVHSKSVQAENPRELCACASLLHCCHCSAS